MSIKVVHLLIWNALQNVSLLIKQQIKNFFEVLCSLVTKSISLTFEGLSTSQ